MNVLFKGTSLAGSCFSAAENYRWSNKNYIWIYVYFGKQFLLEKLKHLKHFISFLKDNFISKVK